MDSQRVHLRSTVVLTQALFDQLPPANPESEAEVTQRVRIVGNTIRVNEASVRGHHVILVADTVTDGSAGTAGITSSLADATAGPQQNGRAGHPMTVVAGKLLGGAGASVGQRGGEGKKGRDGVEMPPIEEPPPEDPFPQGPPGLTGRDGEDGGRGSDGGPGGPVTVVVMTPSPQTARWFGKGGAPGKGGDGGDPEVFPPHIGISGEPGAEGPPGDPGPDVAATVRVVDGQTFRAEVSATLVGGPAADWVRLRQALAEEEFRRGDLVTALTEFDGAAFLNPFEPALSDLLPEFIRDNRTMTGVARDQELVPDVAHHAREYRAAAGDLRQAVVSAGSILAGDTDATAVRIKGRLDELVRPGGLLDDQISDLGTSVRLGLEALALLTPRTRDTVDRLNAVLDGPSVSPIITTAGPGGIPLDAHAVAEALAGVLGAGDTTAVAAPPPDTLLIVTDDGQPPEVDFRPSSDVVTLLPANLELLVHRSVRDRRQIPPAQLAAMTVRARGLAALAQWGAVRTGAADPDGTPVAVDLGRVAADLRAAAGARPVLDLLVELAEITHGWRLARSRIEQQLATRATLRLRRELAARARDRFIPADPGPSRLLPGLRVLLDWLAWYGERADRAADVITFGVTRPAPVTITRFPVRPQLTDDPAAFQSLLYSPDWALELAEDSPQAIPTTSLDAIAKGLLDIDHRVLRDSYLERGFGFVGKEPSSCEVTFTKAERPDLFARLNAVGNFWFDVSLADLAGETGENPQAEARVVGASLTVGFDGPAPPGFGMSLVHYGLSVQRDLAGGLHRQVMLPTEILIGLASSCGSGDCAEASGETRLTVGREIDFPSYGRGVAAGWLVRAASLVTDFSEASTVTVRIYHEAMAPDDAVSLRSVSFAGGALVVGSTVPIRVRLIAAAPAGGAMVSLTSSDPSVVQVPGGVVVPAGATEATALATVLKPTGPRLPVLSASTKDGVTRTVRVAVPAPARAVITVTRLVTDQPATINALTVLPGVGKVPGEVLATVAMALAEPGEPQPPGLLVGSAADDLAVRRKAALGDQPRSVAADLGRGRLYVINNSRGPAHLAMLDATTLQKLAEQPIGMSVDVAVDAAAGLVYVTEFQTGSLRVFSADDLAPRATLTDDEGRLRKPHGLAVVPGSGGGADIYIARAVRGVPDEDSAITRVVRLADGQHRVVRSVTLGPVGLQPVDVAVDVESQMVFVAGLGGGDAAPELVVLRQGSLTEISRARLPRTGRAVATRPGSATAYVVGEEGLTVVDGVSGTVATTIPLGGGLPLAVAADPATDAVYVGMRDDARLIRVAAPARAEPVAW
ncbi:MAG: YncE family protein [Actinomycetales bacterium]